MLYNVYYDESRYLEYDGSNVIVLGAIWCPQHKTKQVNQKIRSLKESCNASPRAELKWTKLSSSKENLYRDLLDYYFADDGLRFNAIVIRSKATLNHEMYVQAYCDALKQILIKDTHTHQIAKEVKDVCCDLGEGYGKIIRTQPIRSSEVQIMQIADILTGATSCANRNVTGNANKSVAKQNIFSFINERTNQCYLLAKSVDKQ